MQAAAGTNPEHQSTSTMNMSVHQLIQKAYQLESVSKNDTLRTCIISSNRLNFLSLHY